jgi:hypothetical protein
MGNNLTLKMGDCNHRRYIPRLLDLVASGAFDPTRVLTQVEPMTDVIEAYKAFDRRDAGWIKVELKPRAVEGLADVPPKRVTESKTDSKSRGSSRSRAEANR